jgi:hypothetical protein
MKSKLIIFCAFLLFLTISLYSQQASLTIINKSDREMTTKVIKGTEKKSELYKTIAIPPKGKQTVYFSETGRYFTKTRAIFVAKDTLTENDTIYNKGIPFDVISDHRGYSNITMKFKVKESKKPEVHGVIPITRREYDTD